MGATVVNTPTCQVKLGKFTICALLDTGADLSVISLETFEKAPEHVKINFTRDQAQLKQCVSASGHPLQTVGKTTLKFNLPGGPLNHTFQIIKGLKHSMILGSDFLAERQACLDFEQKTLSWEGHLVKLGRKGEATNHEKCYLLYPSKKVKVPPRSMVVCHCTPERATPSGTYVATMLDNLQPMSECPFTLPNGLIEIKGRKNNLVTVINESEETMHLPPSRAIAALERVPKHEIQPVHEAWSAMEHPVTEGLPHDETPQCDRTPKLVLGEQASSQQTEAMTELVQNNQDLFAEKDTELGYTDRVEVTIDTGDHPPISQKPYRVPMSQRHLIDKQVQDMLDAGIIKPSDSPWASPVLLVPKRDGTQRFCIDYRRLNRVIVKNSYPLPNIEDILSSLGGAKYYSVLDLKSGYWQLKVADKDQPKTAFICSSGLYEMCRLPFGLCTAPSAFQALMNSVLRGIQYKSTLAYLDDIIIYSRTFEEHLEHVREVFQRLRDAGLKMKLSKCEFLKEEVNFLGHVVTPAGLHTDPEKVKVIRNLAPPKNVRDIRGFLGMCGYYRRFIQDFATLARPLTQLTRKNAHFEWTERCQEAFEKLKAFLTTAPVLMYPNVNKGYKLYTDASLHCVGGILTQEDENGEERVVQYLSHQLTPTQSRYSCIEREMYAIVYCLNKVRHFVLGCPLTILTDHRPLRSLFTAEMKNPRVQRWAVALDEYGASVEYRPGRSMKADFLSRLPKGTPCECDSGPLDEETGEPPALAAIDSDDIIKSRKQLQELMEGLPDVGDDITWVRDIIPKRFGKMQRQDPELKPLYSKLQAGEKVRDYLLERGRLYHLSKPVRRDDTPRMQLVIPEVLVPAVLCAFHDENGHTGIHKTYMQIRQRYYWTTLYQDVIEHLQQCVQCSRQGLRKQRNPMQSMPVPEAPMQFVSLDFSGPYPETTQGNRYILTLICHLTSWPECFSLPDKSAGSVARVLLQEFIPRFGCFETLLSDQGSEFENQLIARLCANLGIAKIRTSAYRPSTNGRSERFHGFLTSVLRKHVGPSQRDWDEWIPCVLSAYRSSVHETTGYSPYFMMYGRDPVLPFDTLLRPKLRYTGEDYLPIMLQRLHHCHVQAKANIIAGQEKSRQYYDQKASLHEFQPGDAVYFHSPRLGAAEGQKLRNRWHPFFRVIEQKSPVTYLIKHQLSGLTKVVHADNLRLANVGEAWLKHYETAERVAAKEPTNARWRVPEDPHDGLHGPVRRQPLRGCRLTAPLGPRPAAAQENPSQGRTGLKRRLSGTQLAEDTLIPPWLFQEEQPRVKRFKVRRQEPRRETGQEGCRDEHIPRNEESTSATPMADSSGGLRRSARLAGTSQEVKAESNIPGGRKRTLTEEPPSGAPPEKALKREELVGIAMDIDQVGWTDDISLDSDIITPQEKIQLETGMTKKGHPPKGMQSKLARWCRHIKCMVLRN